MLERPYSSYPRRGPIDLGIEQRGPEAWRGRLSFATGGAPAERTFDAPSCELVLRAAALMIAFALEVADNAPSLDTGTATTATSSAPIAGPRRQLRPLRIEEAGLPLPSREAEGPRLSLRLETLGGVGVLDGPGLGFGFDLGLAFDRARLRAGLRYWLAQEVPLPGVASGATSVQILGGVLGGCWGGGGPVRLEGCLLGEVGALAGSGVAVVDPRSVWRFWAALAPGVRLALALSDGVALSLGLELGLALARPHLEVINLGEVYRPDFISVRACLGLELFWGWF